MAKNCDLKFDYIKDVLQEEQDEDLPITFEVQGVGRKVSKQRLRVVKKTMIILLMILTVNNRGQYF